jgi:hypothetical protein
MKPTRKTALPETTAGFADGLRGRTCRLAGLPEPFVKSQIKKVSF